VLSVGDDIHIADFDESQVPIMWAKITKIEMSQHSDAVLIYWVAGIDEVG
jgi:hypothetical protein